MQTENIHVIKTLVIGLGTSGTQVCSMLADRIRWEYGDLDRTPWVKFLSLETDASGRPVDFNHSDFIALQITPNEYSDIVKFAPAYDEQIGLSKWADRETLSKIPNRMVDSGVGNIRMIGRLSFFHKKNYDRVRNAVQARIIDLRQLSGSEASEKLGVMADGQERLVSFAGSNTLRIFVVGTLCGGTCSGLAGDFGYFLQSIVKDEEKVVSIFTLPHPDISDSNRLKKNAYTALVELNHYHRITDIDADEITFPGHHFSTRGEQPYDLPYIVTPREINKSSIDEVQMAIKDRIFLNIFVPETDPFSKIVDATIMDRDGHAHSFCTFGLSTLEFPAQQVMDACAKKLLLHAVRNWKSRSLPEHLISPRLEDIGLSYPKIREQLLHSPSGSPINARLDDQIKNVLAAAAESQSALKEQILVLRAAFGEAASVSSNAALPPNIVTSVIADNITPVALSIFNILKTFAHTQFLNFEEGPGRLESLLTSGRDRLEILKQVRPRDIQNQIAATNKAIDEVNGSRKKKNLFARHLTADTSSLAKLRQALEQEVRSRIDRETERALGSTTDSYNRIKPGVAEQTSQRINIIRNRISNLRSRLTAYTNQLDKTVEELSTRTRTINGVEIFEAGSRNGTVPDQYRRCLLKNVNEMSTTFEIAEDEAAAKIIEMWKVVLPRIFSDETDKWLDETYFVGSRTESPLRDEDEKQLLSQARVPFAILRDMDIVSLWSDLSRNEQQKKLETACNKKLGLFLNISETQAVRGGRQPIQKRQMALVPGGTGTQLRKDIEDLSQISDFRDSPDPYRAVLIQEWFRFPLYGAEDIVGNEKSLAKAESNEFPTYHTRKDIHWTGLSEQDIELAHESEQVVCIAILLELLTPEAGFLKMAWSPKGIGQTQIKKLPLSIRSAARALVFERAEVDGEVQTLKDALGTLRDRIVDKRSQFETSEGFVRELMRSHASGNHNYLSDWNDNTFSGRLVDIYCASDPELYTAWCGIFPPDRAQINSMMKIAGSTRLSGGIYPETGLYCLEPTCCGWIGKDEKDAARNGWKCFIQPSHDYSGTY